jgi:hypothetical protein
MKKLIGSLVGATTLAMGAAMLTAPAAQAVTVSSSTVKYVFCSANPNGNHITYYDRYGMVDKYVTLNDKVDANTYCAAVEVGIESDSFVWSSIDNDDSTYVYAAIYEVRYPLFSGSSGAAPQSTLVARDESRDRNGGFNYAIAS